jgi:hypothetical protein
MQKRACAPRILPIVGFVCGFGVFLGWMYFAYRLPLVEVWWTNLQKHRGFYDHMPRSYWVWIALNALEFAVVCGVPTVLAAFALGRKPPGLPLATGVLGTLLVLNLTGKNLSEVARLWLFAAPLVCAAAGRSADEKNLPARLACGLLLMQILLAIFLVSGSEPLLPVQVLTGDL